MKHKRVDKEGGECAVRKRCFMYAMLCVSLVLECFPALSALGRSEGNAVSMSELAMSSINIVLHNVQAEPRLIYAAFSLLGNICVHSVCERISRVWLASHRSYAFISSCCCMCLLSVFSKRVRLCCVRHSSSTCSMCCIDSLDSRRY